jgi:hypothetical protein
MAADTALEQAEGSAKENITDHINVAEVDV